MKYDQLIQPREVKIGSHIFAVSKIPATKAMPIYNVVSERVVSAGIVGVSQLPEATNKAILQYVAWKEEGGEVWNTLEYDLAINNCFLDYRDLVAVISEMVKENFGFLLDGGLLDALGVGRQAAASVS